MLTYGAMIKVIAGFYIGCTGFVVDYYRFIPNKVVVNLRCSFKDTCMNFWGNAKQCEGYRYLEKIDLETNEYWLIKEGNK